MSSRLSSIALKGDVLASSGSNAGGLSGDALDASFTAVDAANSYLSRVLVTGNAKAWDDKDGRLESGLLDITLANTKGSTQSQPVAIKAGGGVKAAQKDSTLAASTVDVTLEQRAAENGRFSTAVAKAVAGGDVRFERGDGVKASTPLLTAMPLEQNVILSGPGSWVGQDATSIKGNTITMHGVNRTLAVEGPGEFTHTQPAAKDSARPQAKATVTWAQGMTFDDRTGLVTCTGSAEALLTRGTLEKDTIKAQRVEVAIGPAPEKGPEKSPQKPTGTGPDLGLNRSDRPLLWALATGDQNPASIELRRYDPAAAGSILKLMYLEGATIRADNTSGRVDVPGRGKLLTVDRERTAEAAAAQGSADSRLAGDSKGTALFAWDGSMMFDRASGTAVLTTLVTVTHKALSDGLVTQLRCDALTAQLESPPASGVDGGGGVTGGPAFAGALRSAEARGQVWLSSRDSEMVAQTLSFDTMSRTVTAKGGENAADLVTVTGQNGAAPVSAHEIFWNLGDNSMRLIGAQPVTAPR